MPSVDVVSKVDLQSLDNVINNVKREVSTRYDFKNITTEVSYDKKTKRIHILSGDDWKVKAITDMLVAQCIRQKLDSKCLDFQEIDATDQGTATTNILIKEGISKELAQKMVKLIKSLKLKVQPAIQDDQLRITGKKIDDLQTAMQELRDADYDIPLQFVNMKR